ncbi:nucleotidyl transferase AbiEii/AbiGii toxin family protein [Sphingobium sp.]|uniref:nucleotidyl transferase AbiEii/AbiGii toxin family protein n=1 Tax=Sphingobium sp. TaxID=1912891 RepID=UPI002C67EE80|nr:nucleotidyl transferase AbiEii/AbiGii toxin family protein [Sphingobium sp.]HUD90061.1 nucleotidyl transferase AbiEii/AbiGii toxin family protein [Sphingobium sp.]
MATEQYRDQVRLLLDVLPLVMAEPVFALKGGTAINLFEWDLPRLSVDIDLTYLPIHDRAQSLRAISEALARIKADIERRLPPTRVPQTRQGQEGMEVKLNCQRGKTQIKVEVNPTLRGHLLPLRDLPCSDQVQERFEAFVEARCLSHGELFGGKICAALDRQHPRDLFDVKRLLDAEGLVDEVRHGFVGALVSHGRPVAELVSPSRKDQSATFKAQFEGMPFEPFTYEDHVETLDRLVQTIHASLDADDRQFLRSFEAGDPEWESFPLPAVRELPAPQFKLMNILRFRDAQPKRHQAGLAALEAALS